MTGGVANTDYQLSFAPGVTTVPRRGEATIVSGNLKYKIYFIQSPIFAVSNIYYDAVAGHLTFGIGDPSMETYQGVYFKFGSLTGIAPTPDNYSTSTVTYPPSGGSTTSSPDWGSIPYTNTGDLVHNSTSIAQGKGDICKYLTSQGWAPPGNWRMPTNDELVFMLNSGGSWVNGTNTSGNNAGTNSIASGWRNPGDINYPYGYFLPASGYRYASSTGPLDNVGTFGYYFSSSPNVTLGYYLGFNSIAVFTGYGASRSNGMAVRCIAE
ncbi:hypothetical protein [Dysgonomonas sp. HGC4]|uniref:hypothetical protein n=1 Tax=Dysgonomonas sp. HGC4 TaxID=1658009 RepID=UPI0012FA0796|nr:hypothetical protein [Dysgonomonas sp. HGC4]MBD8347784.1 hypothetical protein [Dysgonomonas sp. HGC4]